MDFREDEMVVIETRWENINDITYKFEIEDGDFKRLCRKYGIYGIDWYFVSLNTIKYFDDERQCWDYDFVMVRKKILNEK